MSSRVVIRTLKFCTSKIENLEHAIKLLNLECLMVDKVLFQMFNSQDMEDRCWI